MMNIRTRCFLALAVAAAFVAAGCATEGMQGPMVEPAEPEPAMAEAVMSETAMQPDAPEAAAAEPGTPVTEGPATYGIGSTWVFNHTLNGETVQQTSEIVDRIRRKGREVYVVADDGPHRDPGYPCDGANGSLWDVENDAWIACTKDGKILAVITPYHGRFDWPIEVGKTWRTKYFWNDRAIHRDWSGWGWQDWEVAGWEEVTVPAGTFMAYKIVRTRGDWETSTEEVEMFWYAPDVPVGSIKGVWHRSPDNGYGGAEHMWELVSYDVK